MIGAIISARAGNLQGPTSPGRLGIFLVPKLMSGQATWTRLPPASALASHAIAHNAEIQHTLQTQAQARSEDCKSQTPLLFNAADRRRNLIMMIMHGVSVDRPGRVGHSLFAVSCIQPELT